MGVLTNVHHRSRPAVSAWNAPDMPSSTAKKVAKEQGGASLARNTDMKKSSLVAATTLLLGFQNLNDSIQLI